MIYVDKHNKLFNQGGFMKKKSIIAFFICIILTLAFIFVYISDNSKIKKITISDLNTTNSDVKIKIENASINENYLQVSGWAIEKGKTYDYFNWVNGHGNGVYNNNIVVLKDNDGILYSINTASLPRPDVNECINDNIDYRNCGIHAVINVSKLNKNQTYKIGVILTDLDGNKNLVMSDKEITI